VCVWCVTTTSARESVKCNPVLI